MPLIDKQINKVISLLIEAAIKQGRFPGQAILLNEIADIQDRITGGPVFKPLNRQRFDSFDVGSWNKEMGYVEFDLKIIFEELVAQAILLMKRAGWANTAYRAQRGQLDRIMATLNDIQFTQQNAEDHFIGFSDTLTDFSKINLALSTPGVLSLQEKALVIPATLAGTKRILLEEKIREGLQGVVVNSPSTSDVVRSTTASDTSFNNIFHDVAVIWRHDVITKQDSGCEIQVTFPLDEAQSPFRITKASVVPSSESEMRCKILTSFDGSNFSVLPTRDEWMVLNRAASEVAADFEATTVRYIRLILRKEVADELVEDNYRYSFGLANFSLFEASRMPQATYETVVMVPQHGTIEKVALEVDDYRPGGCEIDYYIADDTGEFLPISPVGRPSNRAAQVVRFGDIRELRNQFFASGEAAYTYNALDFFKINPAPLTGESHFGMSQLFRGRNAWSRETSTIEEVRSARDTFVQFTKDTQSLYTYTSATITGEELVAADGTTRTVLSIPSGETLSFARNVSGYLVRPNFGTDVDADEQPKYAVAEVLAVRSAGYEVTGERFILSSTQMIPLANRNLDERIRPTVEYSTDAVTWTPTTEDVGYYLEKIQGEGDYLSGRIRAILSLGGTDVTQHYGRINYTIRRDVTHLVRDVDTTRNKIWLGQTITADAFQVRYRIVPNNIIRKSIVVTERHGEDHGTVFKEGSDYVVNIGAGSISRLENSQIAAGGSCYVDYQWVNEKYSLETYSVWCYFGKPEPEIIKFTAPTIDKDEGETFYMDVDGGRHDLIEAGETPILSRGWYRFTVESKPLTDATAAIRQVLALLDRDGQPLFAGTSFFSEIRAFRAPMHQVSEAKMKFGTRKGDRSAFAIDPNGRIVVNFNPGNSTDLTTLIYSTQSADLVERDEYYEILRVMSTGQTAKGVRLRAVLRRNPNVGTGTTPKVYGWSIRLSR